ncbi:hypothetical protein BDV96DRAFT_332785 [Lophiotrema nucula]|uniref:Uncharacterized protein n=1 Tax=Lophiotrema nucula TaxID=690887 RepID=A0A6A5YH28_9PLEO|nr:hypothetical protein BDV96DRAFT_332785 [Lophiotrema nucula]
MCDCVTAGLGAAKQLLQNDCVPLDILLETSDQVNVHWQRILSCANCRSNDQVPPTLIQIAIRLLGFYEAALRRYSAQSFFELQRITLASFPNSRSISSPTQQNNMSTELRVSASNSVSTRNEMMLGKLAINEEESQMLVQLLLSDYLVVLHDLLDQVASLPDQAAQQWQRNRLMSSNPALCQIMDRVASLTGQLSFNTKKRKRDLGSTILVR